MSKTLAEQEKRIVTLARKAIASEPPIPGVTLKVPAGARARWDGSAWIVNVEFSGNPRRIYPIFGLLAEVGMDVTDAVHKTVILLPVEPRPKPRRATAKASVPSVTATPTPPRAKAPAAKSAKSRAKASPATAAPRP